MAGWQGGVAFFMAVWGLLFFQAPAWAWSSMLLLGMVGLQWAEGLSTWVLYGSWGFVLLFLVVVNVSSLRQQLITRFLFSSFRRILPKISQTESEAIDAGDVWWEGELFRGNPDWKKLFASPKPCLTEEELAFLNNQVEVLCGMIDDWTITQKTLNLPKSVWDYLKEAKFFSFIIPKEYGGLEFSALANSTIVQKIATKSLTAAVTVMVPNSLGPGELLLRYGTEEQKNYYLPRLARGEDIPCFALTGPEAGSDAGNIPDMGVVCRGQFEGKEIIGLRLTWDKRYITLAPIATLLGIAIKMVDPEGLLGGEKDLGITLCLLPANTPGVEIGRRHFPLNQSFLNGPTRGRGVFVPLDWIIGGAKMAGKGWRMLVECLSAGRGISLPAVSTGAAKHCYRTTGAYARIRQQFNTPIGRFEGVEAAMARTAGYTYLLEATRLFTLTAIDQHVSPAVATAIAKYHMTELSRRIVNDAMDIHGGRGIMLGPQNYLGRCYQSMPISITVEGANILTRNLIIFGQGAIRCHPYLRSEMQALSSNDGLLKFDKIFAQHVRYSLANLARLLFHSFTGGFFCASYPLKSLKGPLRQLSRMSLALSCVSEVTLLLMGGKLKRRERLSARLGDILSYLYLASASLKYYQDFGSEKQDLCHVKWVLQTMLYQIQSAFLRAFQNFKYLGVGTVLRFLVFPYGRPYAPPNDRLEHSLAQCMMMPGLFRDRLVQYCYNGDPEQDPVAHLEKTLKWLIQVDPLIQKMQQAERSGVLSKKTTLEEKIHQAYERTVITQKEVDQLMQFEQARKRAIAVDEFSKAELLRKSDE